MPPHGFQTFLSLVTVFAVNFECKRLEILPEIVFKPWHTAICSGCAVWLESAQTHLSSSWSCRIRSAAVHRIWSGTCEHVPIPQFHSETNVLLKVWAEQYELLWTVTHSSLREIHQNFISDGNFFLVTAQSLQIMKTLEPLSLKLARTVALFPKVSLLHPAETAAVLERPWVWLSYLPNPIAWPLNLQSKKPSIAFWIILWDWFQDEHCCLTNE